MSEIFLQPSEELLFLTSQATHTVYATPVGIDLPPPDDPAAEQLAANDMVVPYHSITYDVEAYHVEGGFPVADTALGIGVPVEVTVDGVSASMTPGEILDTDLGATCRWLPVEGSFDDPGAWSSMPAPYVWDGKDPPSYFPRPDYRGIDLLTNATTPELDTDYSYLRNGYSVPGAAMRLSGDDYLTTDALAWAAPSIAVVAVVMLNQPDDEDYGIFETYPADGTDPDRPFVSVRYLTNGRLELHSLGLQSQRQTSTRTDQPIAVGLMIAQTKATLVILDRLTTKLTVTLEGPHPQDAWLYVGMSPIVASGAAVMDILEIDYFEGLADEDALLAKTTMLDGLYGISS